MSSSAAKVSFTIRRPSPTSRASSTGAESDSSNFKVPAIPRHLSAQRSNGSGASSPLGRSSPKPRSRTYRERDSSDEEDEERTDELVTGFDQFGVQRLHEKKREPEGPLVIPALKNRDWRELARKRKMLYVPPSGLAGATTGADGSVGGLGTRDSINSGPQLSGLQMAPKKARVEQDDEDESKREGKEGGKMDVEESSTPVTPAEPVKEETEDQRALRAILAGTNGTPSTDGPTIQIAVSEEDAFNQDIGTLPDSSSLEAYETMPVEQFGAALLRGMGWKDGTAATRKVRKGALIEPWLPQARPALLGIGAKEMEVFDDGSQNAKGGKKRRQDKKYVPLLKVERKRGEDDGERESKSGSSSRRMTPERDRERESSSRRRSPEGSDRRGKDKYDSDYDRDRDRKRDSHRGERDKRRDYDSGSSSRREKSPERHGGESSSSRRRDRDRRDY